MLIVTIAALVMAASLGWFAYRLLQEEQRRADARVALLTAALEDDDPAGGTRLRGRRPWVSCRPCALQPSVAGGAAPAVATPAVPELVLPGGRLDVRPLVPAASTPTG